MGGFLVISESGIDRVLTLGGFLDTHAEFWLWLTLLVMIAEIFTSGFFLGALAISAVLTAGAAAWLGTNAEWQVVLFSVSSIASLLWVRPVAVKLLLPKNEVITNAPALVGRTGTVVAQVPPAGYGRVKLSNEEWRATSSQSLDVGTTVRVQAVEGNTLTVGPV